MINYKSIVHRYFVASKQFRPIANQLSFDFLQTYGFSLQIVEHSAVDTFVAHITVTDVDSSSPNNDVICKLNSSSYSLNTLRDTEYIITVNSDLDREVSGSSSRSISSHSVTITCTDQGYPPLSTQAIILVCNYVCIFGTAENLFVTEQQLLCPQYIL